MEYCSPECIEFLSFERNVVEILFFTVLISSVGYATYFRRRQHVFPRAPFRSHFTRGDTVFACVFAAVFALEIVYKYLSNQMAFLLQPCHAITAVQLFSLFKRDRWGELLFNLHLFWLWGPFLAVALPDTVALQLPYEVETYWVQHSFILITPLYVLATNKYRVYTHATVYWLAWTIMALYHALPLMIVGYLTSRNLNFMLCPAYPEIWEGDFLHSHLWRFHAFWYFLVLCWATGRGTPLIARLLHRLCSCGRAR